jgi:hypothetical protein
MKNGRRAERCLGNCAHVGKFNFDENFLWMRKFEEMPIHQQQKKYYEQVWIKNMCMAFRTASVVTFFFLMNQMTFFDCVF